MFCALYDGDMFAKLDGKVCFVFQNVPQPWHPQTVYLHEVSLLVKKPWSPSPSSRARCTRSSPAASAASSTRTPTRSRAKRSTPTVDIGADKEKIAADLKLMKLVLPRIGAEPELMALTEAMPSSGRCTQARRPHHSTLPSSCNGWRERQLDARSPHVRGGRDARRRLAHARLEGVDELGHLWRSGARHPSAPQPPGFFAPTPRGGTQWSWRWRCGAQV